ncbi:MAG: hypothetical protein V5A29_03195 [Haloarculaceae archaeon]
MPWDRDSSRGLALQPSGLTRREVLVVSGVAVSGCSAVKELGGAEYERSALDLAVGIACASAGSDDVTVTLSWAWDSGNGGSKPDDVLVIDWPDEKWELLTAAHETTETVRFDGKGVVDGMEGVRFRHDDAAADGGTTYAASCKLSPKGEFTPAVRNVFGQFAHVREASDEESSGTQGDGWFGDVTEAWTVARETDQTTSACGDGGA